MKKVFFTLLAGLMVSAQVMAVSVKDVCGQYDGDLNIGGDPYPNRSIYLLPGTVEDAVTFVLPDFTFGKGKLGNIVLPNIPMDEKGMLHLDNATLYLDSISERAGITIINGLEDEGTTYNSIVSNTEAMVVLSITAPSLREPIYVLFVGQAVRNNNYVQPNGAFEGAWTNNEPAGWHSFGTSTGIMNDFVIDHTYQFVPSTQVRPGSNGTQSAMLSSDMIQGVKANGNCTNGQINAGSMDAALVTANYNFSNPANTGFNTPFHGRPDSIVFWAKYIPADRNAGNAVNKARLNAVLTTDAYYQDPEDADKYGDVKIAAAFTNYSATPDFGWQRLSVPFAYYPANWGKKPAYILTTFTTNMLPGGGSSYSTGGKFDKTNVLDTVYLDDVEMVYNKNLALFARDLETLNFEENVAAVEDNYCDSCAAYMALGNGVSTQTFIAFDAAHKCIFVYVIADDYAQSGKYNLYRVDFTNSNTEDILPFNPSEGVENIFSDKARAEKVLINGQLYLRRGDVWYNVSGVRVK